jgi:hypothetical protein
LLKQFTENEEFISLLLAGVLPSKNQMKKSNKITYVLKISHWSVKTDLLGENFY